MKPKQRRMGLRGFLSCVGLSYIFFVLNLHYLGGLPSHRFPWEAPRTVDYLSFTAASRVGLPLALGFGLLMYLVVRTKQ